MDKVRVYLYNDVGQFIGDRAFEINAIPKNATQVRPSDGLFSPTFDGEQWIEGKPELAEKLEVENLLTPSTIDIKQAEFEIRTIELLTDLGVL